MVTLFANSIDCRLRLLQNGNAKFDKSGGRNCFLKVTLVDDHEEKMETASSAAEEGGAKSALMKEDMGVSLNKSYRYTFESVALKSVYMSATLAGITCSKSPDDDR